MQDNAVGWGEPLGAYTEIVYTEPRPGVAVVRMNRPADLNPWTHTMSAELTAAMDAVRAAEHLAVLVFTGTGRAFCAGGEARSILPTYIDSHDALTWAREAALLTLRNVLQVAKDFDKPTIAAVNGVTAGAAFGLTCLCDIRIASDDGRFGNIYMRRGTVPSMSPYYLPQVVGLSRACRLIFADEVIDAREAERIGLVSRVVAPDQLAPVTLDLAEKIARQPVAALRLVKHLLRSGQDSDPRTLQRMGALAAAAGGGRMSPALEYSRAGAVATLRLGAPDAALTAQLYAAAEEALHDDAVRVVVLTGAGSDFYDGDPGQAPLGTSDDVARPQLQALFSTLERSPTDAVLHIDKPTIAAINGSATGLGFDLMLCCDMRLAVVDAHMAATDLRRGMVAGLTTFLLPRIVGLGTACELLFTGQAVDGREAERIGLVDRAVPAAEFDATLHSLAERIAKGPPVATRFTKRALYRGLSSTMDAAKEYTTLARTLGMRITEETREGFQSFVEKREPRF